MITKTVNRYYCEHCQKGGQSKRSIERHEKSCFRNPERVCWMCSHHGLQHVPLKVLMESARSRGLSVIRDLTECPACISAALFQSRPEDPDEWIYYDYRTETEKWIKAKGQEDFPHFSL